MWWNFIASKCEKSTRWVRFALMWGVSYQIIWGWFWPQYLPHGKYNLVLANFWVFSYHSFHMSKYFLSKSLTTLFTCENISFLNLTGILYSQSVSLSEWPIWRSKPAGCHWSLLVRSCLAAQLSSPAGSHHDCRPLPAGHLAQVNFFPENENIGIYCHRQTSTPQLSSDGKHKALVPNKYCMFPDTYA